MKHTLRITCLPALLMLLLAAVLFLPQQSYAQAGGFDLDQCAPMADWMITTKVVTCVRQAIMTATGSLVGTMVGVMQPIMMALFTLALALCGIRVMASNREALKIGIAYILRMGTVIMIFFMLPALVAVPFGVSDDLINIVTGGFSPWATIDNAIGELLGTAPGLALFQGVVGLIGAALFSSTAGLTLFFFGFMVLISLIGLMMRAVYTYLVSMVLIGFCMAVSPLLVPLSIMQITERYTKKWFDVLIAAMIMPMLLFAALWMFLDMVNTTVDAVYEVLGGNDFRRFWRNNAPVFSWMMVTDPTIMQQYEQGGLEKGTPAIQSFISPLLGRGMDANMLRTPGIDFGEDHQKKNTELILAFVEMGVVCVLLRSLLDMVPKIADDIAQVATRIEFEDMMSSFKKGLGSFGKMHG